MVRVHLGGPVRESGGSTPQTRGAESAAAPVPEVRILRDLYAGCSTMASAHGCGPCYGGSIPLSLPVRARGTSTWFWLGNGEDAGKSPGSLVRMRLTTMSRNF